MPMKQTQKSQTFHDSGARLVNNYLHTSTNYIFGRVEIYNWLENFETSLAHLLDIRQSAKPEAALE